MAQTVSDMLSDEPIPTSGTPTTGLTSVDRLNPFLVKVLTVLGFGLPLAGYLLLLQRFSIDAIYGDQWDDVTVINASYTHLFPWAAMWVQHTDNRIFFPNAFVVLLAHTAHFNIKVEEYLSAIFLVAAVGLLIWTHRRRSKQTPWLYYCPVAILGLSIVQFGNMLWGFQMAWFLVLLSLALTLYLIDRPSLTWVPFAGAIAFAVVGSFSLLSGLLIWPSGLVLLYYRRRSWPYAVAWLTAALATAIVYFHNYAFSPGGGFARQHPMAALKFFFFLVGDIVGTPVTQTSNNGLVILFGVLIVLAAVGTVLLCGFRRDTQSSSPLGVALICFGLLFAATVTQGRSFFGLTGASWSRYTTFDLLILIGIYLALLGRAPQATPVAAATETESGALSKSAPGMRKLGRAAIGAFIAVAIPLQILLGIHNGLAGARTTYTLDVKAVALLRNIDHTSDGPIGTLYLFHSPSFIRKQAHIVRSHHLSIFSTGVHTG